MSKASLQRWHHESKRSSVTRNDLVLHMQGRACNHEVTMLMPSTRSPAGSKLGAERSAGTDLVELPGYTHLAPETVSDLQRVVILIVILVVKLLLKRSSLRWRLLHAAHLVVPDMWLICSGRTTGIDFPPTAAWLNVHQRHRLYSTEEEWNPLK